MTNRIIINNNSKYQKKIKVRQKQELYNYLSSRNFNNYLKPLEENTKPLFAQNGISFEGEEKFTKYGNSLQYSLNQWMHGQDLKLPVYKWFDFSVPKPTVSINFIQKKIESYESQRNKEFSNPLPQNKKRIFWLGENKISLNKSEKIAWFYMGDYYEAKKTSNETVFRGKGLCVLPDWPIFK